MSATIRSIRRHTCLAILAGMGLLALPLPAADHLDAPRMSSPGFDGRMDINDVYVFQSPADPASTVLVMTIDPVAAVLSPLVFNPLASYEFPIDTNADAREDLTFSLRFDRPLPDGRQWGQLRCEPAHNCPLPDPASGKAFLAAGPSGTVLPVAGGGSLQFGLFDDPFFFDLAAFLGAYDFCNAPGGTPGASGVDFFAGLNTMAIVLEVPSQVFGRSQIGVWGRTVTRAASSSGQQRQVDRMGRPAINTVFIPSDQKNAFNEAEPKTDRARFGRFLGDFAGALLPDILTVDVANPQGFLNGRRLEDDVIDLELQLITGNPAAGDCVDASDNPFSTTFPYLAAPNGSTAAASASMSTSGGAGTSSAGDGGSGVGAASATTAPTESTSAVVTTRGRSGDSLGTDARSTVSRRSPR